MHNANGKEMLQKAMTDAEFDLELGLKLLGWSLECMDAEGVRLFNYKLQLCLVIDNEMVSVMRIPRG